MIHRHPPRRRAPTADATNWGPVVNSAHTDAHGASLATEAPRRRRTYSVSRLIQDRQRGHNLRSITTTLRQPFTTTTFANRALRYSAPPVWNTLPQTVLNSDSVAIFKSRLKIFLFSHWLSLLPVLTNTPPGPSASEVTTLWRYTNLFIIIIL